MKVAYLVNQYPKVSHSFIRREILALERQGIQVMRVAVRGWDATHADPEDARECAQTQYVLEKGLLGLWGPVLRTLACAPGRFLAGLRLAWHMSRRADRPWPYHLIYLAEACMVALLVRRGRAEHLHAHFGTNPAEVAMVTHVLCGVPYSFTVHGMDEVDRARFLGLDEKVRRSAFVVAVSSFGRSQLFRWVAQEDWRKISIVHCGLEPAFHDTPPVPPPERPRLVCVGRLSAEKGQLLLLEAGAVLARQGVAFELVLAGDGDMRAQLEAAVVGLGLERQVRITGWISGTQVRGEIEGAKALVLPSFIEGLPVVLMEAMALRRPVLATYVGGVPELVVDGEHGWLFPAGSVEALADAMKDCLAAPREMLVRMGDTGRERVLARHDVDREAARLAALFRAAVIKRPEEHPA